MSTDIVEPNPEDEVDFYQLRVLLNKDVDYFCNEAKRHAERLGKTKMPKNETINAFGRVFISRHPEVFAPKKKEDNKVIKIATPRIIIP